jgi:hypothetical protein
LSRRSRAVSREQQSHFFLRCVPEGVQSHNPHDETGCYLLRAGDQRRDTNAPGALLRLRSGDRTAPAKASSQGQAPDLTMGSGNAIADAARCELGHAVDESHGKSVYWATYPDGTIADGRRPGPPVLSLFPGAGLLDRGFEQAGFCVVRGPDTVFGQRVEEFHAAVSVRTGAAGLNSWRLVTRKCPPLSTARHLGTRGRTWLSNCTGQPEMLAMQQFVCLKDLAQSMKLSPRSVKRWWKRLGVPPSVAVNACHRWTQEDADKLIARWQAHHLQVVVSRPRSGPLPVKNTTRETRPPH